MPRPLARKNDGCYECCKRRLRCDKSEPECLKCQKKDIQCSGQGLHCRFSSHMNLPSLPSSTSRSPRGINKRQSTSPSSRTLSPLLDLPRSVEKPSKAHLRLVGEQNSNSSAAKLVCRAASSEPTESQEILSLVQARGTPLRASLNEATSPQARMLFNHFCEHVAPIMVVLDSAGNGYRDIILPLAVQDDVLARAVCVVAAFHLAQKAPQLQQAALAGHHAIVEKLRRDSLQLSPEQVFTPYTWATIMVLLVGDTITGADNYLYLVEMLTCLRRSPEIIRTLPLSLRRFFIQQVKMFELFGFPLSDEAKGLDITQQSPDSYMEFMSYPTLPAGSEHQTNLQIIRDAIRDACNLYRQRALSSLTAEESISKVERLRQRVLPLNAQTPGAHALVWTYFVAAAESVLPEHRLFFSLRLRELYDFTGFGSISAALKALKTIWAMQGFKRWTEIVCKDLPVLVM